MRARPVAVMATRWSRLHGVLYMRRQRDDGVVADVEELTVVLWFRGIRQWRSVWVIWLGGGHGLLGHRARMEEDDREGNGEMKRE